ncbi:MAG TPA: PKD domain-containing protein [Tepidisphaeraceae bacterium]|nr:PKD domain-containing protein [Tepidisphaeraceae bacterium]
MPRAFLALLLFAPCASAAWFDNAYPFRREITVAWDADKPTGSELALAEVLTAGRHKPDGADVRVAADDGRPVPFRLLAVGPGDTVRVVFAPVKGQRKYAVYFGNPSPKPRSGPDLPITAGLLLDMRTFAGQRPTTADALLALWSQSTTPIGQTMIPGLSLGKSPLGDLPQWIARLSGTLTIPADGDYTFAASANSLGLLTINNKPVVFAPNLVGDTRYNAKVTLTKGKHPIDFYHLNAGGEGILSVVWKRPGSEKFELLGKDALGQLHFATPGPLEEIRKTLTADFKVEFLGESFFANHYAYRYRFTAYPPKASAHPPKYEWDLGDGQTATGPTVDHVYLADGVYPIKLTARIGANADSQTTRLHVARDVAIDKPKIDEPAVHAQLTETYKLDRLPPAHLPWLVLLYERAGRLDPMLTAAARLATLTSDFDPAAALTALNDATDAALAANRAPDIAKVWAAVPAHSPMQPAATRAYADLLVWRLADFDTACKVLAPLIESRRNATPRPADQYVERLYAHALILNGRPADGRKLLEAMPIEGPPDKHPAMAGAIARSVEYYVTQSEPDAGEEQWERWQRTYPADFLDGYSALLRVRLIETRKQPDVAAKVAQAFALALPKSTYAPTLLDKASKLFAPTNPAKSAELRALLKQKYPEDPLSQDK